MSKILRINMTDRTATHEDVPDKYKFLAGRGLTSTMVYDEVDPTCHPLGPNNKLVFAPGIVSFLVISAPVLASKVKTALPPPSFIVKTPASVSLMRV